MTKIIILLIIIKKCLSSFQTWRKGPYCYCANCLAWDSLHTIADRACSSIKIFDKDLFIFNTWKCNSKGNIKRYTGRLCFHEQETLPALCYIVYGLCWLLREDDSESHHAKMLD